MFAPVLVPGQDLQVGGDVEATDEGVAKRDDMVDLMPNAGVGSQLSRLFIEAANTAKVRPWWCGAEFVGQPRSSRRSSSRSIGPRPLRCGCGHPLSVALSPLRFLGAVLQVIAPNPFSPVLCAVPGPRLRVRFFTMCSAARCLSGQICRAFKRIPRSLSGQDLFSVRQMIAPILFGWCHCLLSMCESTIRRTSSAIEMPRRVASRFRNCRCGSVNEIICFVMAAWRNDAELALEALRDVFQGRGCASSVPVEDGVRPLHFGRVQLAIALNMRVTEQKHAMPCWGHALSIPQGIR